MSMRIEMRGLMLKCVQCLMVVGGLLAGLSGSPAELRGDDPFANPQVVTSGTPFYGNSAPALPPSLAPQHFTRSVSHSGEPQYSSAYQPPFTTESGWGPEQPNDSQWNSANVDPDLQCNAGNACCGPKFVDHFDVFGGLDGSKQPQDFGVNALFGGRVAVNAGWLLEKDWGLGLQAATSLNFSDNAVQVFERVGGPTHRVQNYSTLALYQRAGGFNWGFGFDLLRENYYDQFLLGQWRGKGGYLFTKTDEFGAWFTIPQIHDSGSFAGLVPLTLKPIQQAALFWTHQWESQAYTTLWGGYSRRHGEVNLALGDFEPVTNRPSFGAEVHVPLNDHCALFGQANFLSPFDTGTVDAFLGITFYPGGGARRAPSNVATPVLPVANNTMFSTNLTR